MPQQQTSLSALIKRARIAADLKIDEAAAAFHCTGQQWRYYETGERQPPLKRLERLAKILRVDLRQLLSAWATSTLDAGENPALRQLLGSWVGSDEDQDIPRSTVAATIEEGCLDQSTARLAVGIMDQLAHYRRELTSQFANVKFVRAANAERASWRRVTNLNHVFERPLAVCREGIGFYSTLVKIEAGYGVQHRHVESPFLDTVIEFFAVVDGCGRLIVEKDSKPPVVQELRPKIVGQYPAEFGHTFVAYPGSVLELFVVSCPFPPQLLQDPTKPHDRGAGFAITTEFSIDAVAEAELAANVIDKVEEMREMETTNA